MAPKRQATPTGTGGIGETVKDGTLILQPSAAPGPVGAAPQTPPPLFPVLLCEKGHTIFTPTWASRDGDTNSGDPQAYNALSPDAQARVDPYLNTSDDDLKQRFREFITDTLSTGDLGGSMVDRFFDGSQTVMKHPIGSPLSEMAKYTSSLLDHAMMVRDKIGDLLDGHPHSSYDFLAGKIDVPTVNFSTTSSALAAYATGLSGKDLTLKALIGGTQGLRLTLQNLKYYRNHSTTYKQFAVDLRYEIFDCFGVGNDDVYTSWIGKREDSHDALVSFWILQHMRVGHRPFVNWIELERSMIGNL
jgi:hypothetical protein